MPPLSSPPMSTSVSRICSQMYLNPTGTSTHFKPCARQMRSISTVEFADFTTTPVFRPQLRNMCSNNIANTSWIETYRPLSSTIPSRSASPSVARPTCARDLVTASHRAPRFLPIGSGLMPPKYTSRLERMVVTRAVRRSVPTNKSSRSRPPQPYIESMMTGRLALRIFLRSMIFFTAATWAGRGS